MVSQPTSSVPMLQGLVLAGGESRRMGRDKGGLRFGSRPPQAQWAWALLDGLCERAFVSVRSSQHGCEPYRALPLILDEGPIEGPMAGLLSAWHACPNVAWLVLAADMPLVDRSTLATLIETRTPSRLATAFRHPDGTWEPLCAIWEPAARPILVENAAAGRLSLSRVLRTEAARVCAAVPREPARLVSVNSPRDFEALAAQLAPHHAPD